MTIKRCKMCGYDLHINAFPMNESRGVRYRRNVCRLCMAAYHKWREQKRGITNVDKALYMRRWRLQRALARLMPRP